MYHSVKVICILSHFERCMKPKILRAALASVCHAAYSKPPPGCTGDLGLISELLPDLTGFDGLPGPHSGNSTGDNASKAETSVRPFTGPQAEPDGLAFMQDNPETFDSYAPTASGNIYEAARTSAQPQRTVPYQVHLSASQNSVSVWHHTINLSSRRIPLFFSYFYPSSSLATDQGVRICTRPVTSMD